MAKLHRFDDSGRTLRSIMGAAAALCVLGLASLLWLHNSPEAVLANANASNANVSDTQGIATSPTSVETGTGVPAAENVFPRDRYVPPEEPIAQF